MPNLSAVLTLAALVCLTQGVQATSPPFALPAHPAPAPASWEVPVVLGTVSEAGAGLVCCLLAVLGWVWVAPLLTTGADRTLKLIGLLRQCAISMISIAIARFAIACSIGFASASTSVMTQACDWAFAVVLTLFLFSLAVLVGPTAFSKLATPGHWTSGPMRADPDGAPVNEVKLFAIVYFIFMVTVEVLRLSDSLEYAEHRYDLLWPGAPYPASWSAMWLGQTHQEGDPAPGPDTTIPALIEVHAEFCALALAFVALAFYGKGRWSGMASRVCLALAFVTWYQVSSSPFNNIAYMCKKQSQIMLTCVVLCLSPNLDEPLFKKGSSRWPLLVLKLMIFLPYFNAGVWKLAAKDWTLAFAHGDTIRGAMVDHFLFYEMPLAPAFFQNTLLCVGLSVGTLVFELLCPLLLLTERLDVMAGFVAFSFHLGIYWTMRVNYLVYWGPSLLVFLTRQVAAQLSTLPAAQLAPSLQCEPVPGPMRSACGSLWSWALRLMRGSVVLMMLCLTARQPIPGTVFQYLAAQQLEPPRAVLTAELMLYKPFHQYSMYADKGMPLKKVALFVHTLTSAGGTSKHRWVPPTAHRKIYEVAFRKQREGGLDCDRLLCRAASVATRAGGLDYQVLGFEVASQRAFVHEKTAKVHFEEPETLCALPRPDLDCTNVAGVDYTSRMAPWPAHVQKRKKPHNNQEQHRRDTQASPVTFASLDPKVKEQLLVKFGSEEAVTAALAQKQQKQQQRQQRQQQQQQQQQQQPAAVDFATMDPAVKARLLAKFGSEEAVMAALAQKKEKRTEL